MKLKITLYPQTFSDAAKLLQVLEKAFGPFKVRESDVEDDLQIDLKSRK
jgi:hypothetical protein